MMFRQALADLKDKYPQRLQLVSIFSQERLDSDLLFGRIDGEKLQALAKTLINFRQYDEAFICGPSAMMDDAEATLKALGMPDKSIHLERFNTPGTTAKRAVHDRAAGRARPRNHPDGGRRKHPGCRPASGGGSSVCLQGRRVRHL
jgi:ring-1,2-phenylacetyl-CoA epoxidase subunit PaaE